MAYRVPSTEELRNSNIAEYVRQLGREVPINQRAFLRVLSVVQASGHKSLYNFAAERIQQVFALTATGVDLDVIGGEFDTPRRQAEATRLTATVPAADGVVIPQNATFTGQSNGVRYFLERSAVGVEGTAELSLTAQSSGSSGNLAIGEILVIEVQIPSVMPQATVTTIINTGADVETDDVYRERVLFAERSTPGGGDSTDYKIWGEGVAGVLRVYPYAGKPARDPLPNSLPGDRTVYVETLPEIHPDGIASDALLQEVRDDINLDPSTSRSRAPLGHGNDTLFVRSITRSSFNVYISGLDTPQSELSDLASAIRSGLDGYFRLLRPFVEGVDLAHERNDVITPLTICPIVQAIVDATGSSAVQVQFARIDSLRLDRYRLAQGELAKLEEVFYE